MQPTNYIALSRASTDEQGKKGLSHETQFANILRNWRVNEWNCVKQISENISGTIENRSLYDSLYKDILKGKIQVKYILVQKWSRFSRNAEFAHHWIKKFKTVGVEVNAVDQWISYDAGVTNTTLGIYIGIAADESERISRFTRDNIHKAKENGFYVHPLPPKGWDKKLYDGTKRKTLVPKHPTYDVVKSLLTDYNKDLYSQAFLHKKYNEFLQLSRNNFAKCLFHPAHAGLVFVPSYKNSKSDVYVKSKWNEFRMIDDAIYFENLEIRVHRSRKPTVSAISLKNYDKYWLKGMLYCKRTGVRMTASKNKGRKKYYPAYHGVSKGTQRISVDKAHSLIESVVSDIFDLKAFKSEIVTILNGIKKSQKSKLYVALNTKKDKLIKANQRIFNLNELFATGDIELGEYREMKSNVERVIEVLELDINQIEQKIKMFNMNINNIAKDIMNVGKVFKNSTHELKAEFLKIIFPNGFYLDLETGKVGTPEINRMVLLLTDNQLFKKLITINKSLESPFAPSRVEDVNDLEHLSRMKELHLVVKKMVA